MTAEPDRLALDPGGDFDHTKIIYRCSCGNSFDVQTHAGGVCPKCERRVTAIALRLANSATISIDELDFKIDDREIIAGGPRTESEGEATQIVKGFDDDIPSGTMLGHFRLEQLIGRGGMGSVYRALDTSLQRYVAVKVIRRSRDNQHASQRVAHSLREAVAQARLNHPNVVTIYYVGRHQEEPFLAMELVHGTTLNERVRREGSLRYDEAISIMLNIVDALEHASLFDIVHADIKPSNLMIARDGSVKLSDFGLARTEETIDESVLAGTPAYLAPELIDGDKVSMQSDMYALGVTFFETCFGRLPFNLEGRNLREQLETVRTSPIGYPIPWPSSIPRGLVQVIDKLMAKKASDRFENYESLKHALKRVQPASVTIAGLAARVLSFTIDQIMLLMLLSPFAAGIFYLETTKSQYRLLIPLIALAALIVPGVYLFLTWRGWPSLGRYLFQLRITEENGLRPGREQLVTREILRNMFAWLTPLAVYFSLYYPPLQYILFTIMAGFMVAECASVFLFNYRRTLHDMLCHSRVVLDVRPLGTTDNAKPRQ